MQVEILDRAVGEFNSSVNPVQNGRVAFPFSGFKLQGKNLDLEGDLTASTLKIPPKIGIGTVIPGLINAATWRDKRGRIYAFGRQMLGRGEGVPDPSNSVLIICDNEGNVLRDVVVAKPNEKGEQFEDWRADQTDHGTVILAATWTKKTGDREFKAQGAWMEVSSNWDGILGEVRHVPEAGWGKNATPWDRANRMMFRRDESPQTLDDYVIKDDRLEYAGEVQMPGNVRDRFSKCGTTYAPEIGENGDGTGTFHFQELMPDGRVVYSIRRAAVHMNGRLVIDRVDLEQAITKADFRRFNIPELRQDIPLEVVYQTGEGFINVADRETVVIALPGQQ